MCKINFCYFLNYLNIFISTVNPDSDSYVIQHVIKLNIIYYTYILHMLVHELIRALQVINFYVAIFNRHVTYILSKMMNSRGNRFIRVTKFIFFTQFFHFHRPYLYVRFIYLAKKTISTSFRFRLTSCGGSQLLHMYTYCCEWYICV